MSALCVRPHRLGHTYGWVSAAGDCSDAGSPSPPLRSPARRLSLPGWPRRPWEEWPDLVLCQEPRVGIQVLSLQLCAEGEARRI